MFEVKFADIGEGIHEGILYKWLVTIGEEISEGQGLFMVETDKVTAEIPSPVSGKIHELHGKVGEIIYVGHTIVVIDEGNEALVVTETPPQIEAVSEKGSTSVVGEIEVSSQLIPSSTEAMASTKFENNAPSKVLATPVARKLAKDLGVDISQVKGSGPVGRVMKEDIMQARESIDKVEAPVQKSESDANQGRPVSSIKMDEFESRIKMSMRRKSISKNMVLSKFTIPHASAMDEIDVTDLVAFRTQNKEMASALGYKLTYMPFIIKAVVLSLKENPVLNASLDNETDELILKKYYNIGIAIDDEEGLIVPVIHGADHLGILDVAERLNALIEVVEARRIGLKDIQNGTFTITNYGSVGALFGVPVIRYPEAAVLGVGTITKKPVVMNDEIVIRSILPVSISFDHRIVDGGDAGRFLMSIKKYLSNPSLLLIR